MRLTAGLPETSSVYADEGTAAHFLGAECLTLKRRAFQEIGREIGVRAENGHAEWATAAGGYRTRFTVDAAMAEFVDQYQDYCHGLGRPETVRVEQWADLTQWHGEPSGGTADFVAVIGTALHVADLKFGRGERVEAKANGQLRQYALGALDLVVLLGFEIETVHWHICQPRLAHWDTDACSLAELLSFGSEVQAAAARTREPNAPLVAGPAQCRWCRAKHFCPEIARHSQLVVTQAVEASEFPVWREPVTVAVPEALTDAQIAAILPQADMIETWLNAVRAEAVRRLAAGDALPGWKLVQGRMAPRKWRPDTEETLVHRAQELGHPRSVLFEAPKLLTPAALEKAVGKKQFGEFAAMTEQSPGKPALAPESDKRPALSPTTLPSDFSVFDEGTES